MQNIRWSTWRTSYGEYEWRPNATGDQTPNQITRSLLAGHTFVRLIKATLKRFMVVSVNLNWLYSLHFQCQI
ncbi:hypothetical protein Anas_09199 [Armadillidium nasatum]|uniref:Uncharacterized protein n=1 Tax=Armadillidium nasatum TaxID=96803 RepID=A0A5N5SMA9_9CRUS|nr:hypothetical protein Anas_09199 [Armadillidium nasatum]